MTRCPTVFHEEVKRAMFESRWHPYESGGQKVSVLFATRLELLPPGP